MNTGILDKFTGHLKNTLAKSYSLATELSSPAIHPEHLLLALLSQRGSMGGELLRQAGLGTEELRQMLIAVTQFSPEDEFEGATQLSAESKRTIEKAVLTASTYEHKYVGTEHLLSGILEINSPVISAIFSDQNINIHSLKDQLENTLRSTTKFPEITETFESGEVPGKAKYPETTDLVNQPLPDQNEPQALEFFTVDLTDPKTQEGIDPVIGREKEIERLVQILCRRNKNNPVLLGEPGVGKTAIIEGLAKKIVEGDVPDVLANKRILALDLGMMIAGTIYRGEFEGRIKQITDEAKANPDIILFIDELHNIMGAGSTNGSMDAANLLKPALARGTMRCIGATTIAEYKKHIESDGALERRFQSILVEQPTPDAAMEILRGLKIKYENHHAVTIDDSAIEAAVLLSERYLTDRQLPDKAIDLIDEASARTRIYQKGNSGIKMIERLEKELEKIQLKKQAAVHGENFILALEMKGAEEELIEKIGQIKNNTQQEDIGLRVKITAEHIASIVSLSTGVPLAQMMTEEKTRLLDLENHLKRRIVGQEEAVVSVAEMVRRAKAGMASPQRPLASFLFMGPSGVGKTELAKVLGEVIFGDPNAVVRIDMSEFSEGFNMSKLVGAPAGYVGYREETKLTDLVKRKPHSLVLFDEIEKAHPDVHNLLLQILEDGHITDATGRKINFKNTIIVMTSNVGASEIRTAGIGFTEDGSASGISHQDAESTMRAELERSFRPEFINRMDKIIVFKSLSKDDMKSIVQLHFNELIDRLVENHEINITVDENVLSFLAEKSWNPAYGARTIRRQIQEHIESPLARNLLSDIYSKGDIIKIEVENGNTINFNKTKSAKTADKKKADQKKTKATATTTSRSSMKNKDSNAKSKPRK